MKVLLCAYRNWALEVCEQIMSEHTSVTFCTATSQEHLERLVTIHSFDAIITIGWSWKISAEIVKNNIVVGMHPSDLPDYAGGSPIQNQILDGVETTRATLFKLNEKFDEGEIVDKEFIDLRGHLDDVLKSIGSASVQLVSRFLTQFPNNTYTKQAGVGKKVRRLKPADSQLQNLMLDASVGEFFEERTMTCKEMWNHIRCRENPYPNAYFEDETGRLTIVKVEFEPK